MTDTQRAADLALLDRLGRKAPDEWTDAETRAAWQAWDRALAQVVRQDSMAGATA